MKNKFFSIITVALLLCCSLAYGQVTLKEVRKAVRTGNPLENAADPVLIEPSFPVSNLWTIQDSSGTIVKFPFEKLSPKTRGDLYYFGRGVERDLDKAVECYALVAAGDKASYWSEQYIKYLKQSPYLDIDQKLCSLFARNLGENNDYIERVVKNNASVTTKRDLALAWATIFFKPEEYKIESSDNSSKLIIKFQYNDNFWVPLTIHPGTKREREIDSEYWYSFGGEIILDFKEDRYRIRIAYPLYSSKLTTSSGYSSEGNSGKVYKKVIIELMNESRRNITLCLRYLNGIELVSNISKNMQEKIFHDNEQDIFFYATPFCTIMGKYSTIMDSIESSLSKAVDKDF